MASIRDCSTRLVLAKDSRVSRPVSHPAAIATTPASTATPSPRRTQSTAPRDFLKARSRPAPANTASARELIAPSAYAKSSSVVCVLGPLRAAPVSMRPRIGPAHGAQRNPVATPSAAEGSTLSDCPAPCSRRLPNATNGRASQSATRWESSATPNAASSTSASSRPKELTRTAQAPPTAARVAMAANVTAMPASSGSVPRAKERCCRANTNGNTGRMHGLRMVSAPPRNARASSSMLVSKCRDRHRLALIERGQRLLEVADLRQIIEGDIRVGGIPQEEVLVVVLGPEKSLQRVDTGGDRRAEHARLVELRNISDGDLSLGIVGVEDRRAILRARIRTLAVHLGRVVRDGKENLQDLAVGDQLRVKGDLD